MPCSRVTWLESAPMLTDKNIRNDNSFYSAPRFFSCIFWTQSFEYRTPRFKRVLLLLVKKRDFTAFSSSSRNFAKSIVRVYKQKCKNSKLSIIKFFYEMLNSPRRYCMINIIHPSVDLCWLKKNSYSLHVELFKISS